MIADFHKKCEPIIIKKFEILWDHKNLCICKLGERYFNFIDSPYLQYSSNAS